MQNIIKKFIYKGEFLEFNIKDQIEKERYKFKFLIIVLLKKLTRNLYRIIQRNLQKPSIRNFFSSFEKKFFRLGFSKTHFEDKDMKCQKLLNMLNNNSFCELDNILTDNQIIKIKEFLNKKKPLDIYETSINKKMPMSYFKTEDLVKSEEILNVVNNEDLIKILNNYFQANFKLDWIWSWNSYVENNNQPIGPQLFHRDYETLNFLKLFIYLSDVEGLDGSHQLIKNTDKIDQCYKIKRYSDDEIFSKFENNDCVTIDGKTGKNFLVNSFALHRGLKPLKKDRLILCYLFSVYPSRRSPKIPPVNISEIKNNKKKFIENKKIFDLFVNFKK